MKNLIDIKITGELINGDPDRGSVSIWKQMISMSLKEFILPMSSMDKYQTELGFCFFNITLLRLIHTT